MKIRIETWEDYKYEPISRRYGKILNKYGLENIDDKAFIVLGSFEQLFQLHHEIEISDEGGCFFGIITKQDSDSGEYYLEIKDNFD